RTGPRNWDQTSGGSSGDWGKHFGNRSDFAGNFLDRLKSFPKEGIGLTTQFVLKFMAAFAQEGFSQPAEQPAQEAIRLVLIFHFMHLVPLMGFVDFGVAVVVGFVGLPLVFVAAFA